MPSQTQEAIAALRTGNKEAGRLLLKGALETGEPPAPIWYAFSLAADSLDERRIFLQKTLEADPLHEDARRELASCTAAAPPAISVGPRATPLLPGEGEAATSVRALSAPAKQGMSLLTVLLLLTVGACALFAMLGGGGSGGGGRPAVTQPDKYGAWYVCTQQITGQLKAPSTAKFPRVTDTGVIATTVDNQKWAITGFVDAQNGFGAMMRSAFVCEATHTSGTNWSVRATLVE